MSSSTTHPALNDPNAFVLYRYTPSLAAAIIFTVLFIITTGFHVFQLIRYRTFYFIPLFIGGCFELLGYIFRALSSENPWSLGPFVGQTLLLLLAPALFAASIYMLLGRMIQKLGGTSYHAVLSPRWLTPTFVTGDVLSFLLQATGGGIMAQQTISSMKLGQQVIVGGLFVQLAFFGVFILTTAIFQYRMRKRPTRAALEAPFVWEEWLGILYAASGLIVMRSVFRVVEYLMGNDGYILRHEAFLYLFDGLLMLGVMVLFNVLHPSEVTGSRRKRGQEIALDSAN